MCDYVMLAVVCGHCIFLSSGCVLMFLSGGSKGWGCGWGGGGACWEV